MRLYSLWVAVALAGCPAAQQKDDEKPVGAAPPSIVGRYAHEGCVPVENADGTQSWAKYSAEMTPTTWAMDTVIYGEGPYTILGPSAKVPGAYEVDFSFAKRTVTPHVPGYVALLQSYSCGKAPYAVNEAQDILESGCKDLGYQPLASCPKSHDIVKLEGDTLTLGKRPADNDMCAPEKRAAELSPLTFARVP